MTTQTIKPVTPFTGITPRKLSTWEQVWREKVSYLFIAPAYISLAVFFIYPVGLSLVASFTNYDAFNMRALPHSIFDNYVRALVRDPKVLQSFKNVLQYTLQNMFIGQTFALLLAIFLNSLRKGSRLFRTIYYLPCIASLVTVASLFSWIFGNDSSSVFNAILHTLFGFPPVRWLYTSYTVLPIMSLICIWGMMGGATIIWMAGLKTIPKEYYEAAIMDGASAWRQFWGITIPLLKPIIIYVSVTYFIGSMQEFGLPLLLTGGGPAGASNTPNLLIYVYGWGALQMGYGAAISWLLAIVLLAVSVLQFRLFGATIAYD